MKGVASYGLRVLPSRRDVRGFIQEKIWNGRIMEEKKIPLIFPFQIFLI